MSEHIRSKDQIFYLPLEKRPPTEGCRKFLIEYAKISDDDLDEHLKDVRDLAWEYVNVLLLNCSSTNACNDTARLQFLFMI